MKKNKLFIANWKMNMSFEETINFITSNYDKLVTLSKKNKIILCPSFTKFYTVKQILKDTPIYIGAQNCSKHLRGSFTGEVSVIDLNYIGCEYCIIGHSESRENFKETDSDIIKKLENLFDYEINPIICIGEKETDYNENKTILSLEKQLEPIFTKIKKSPNIPEYLEICIAYEPIWSIGTGKIASASHLEIVFAWINEITQKKARKLNWKLIYGGSINSENIKMLKKIKFIDGFLIGGASLSFQEFEKIVNSDILK